LVSLSYFLNIFAAENQIYCVLILKSKEQIKRIAQETILTEYESIRKLYDDIDDTFAECVEIIYKSSGRLIITGIGKSAIIAKKIVATLNSTGTPSIFMHAADAIHGDLGIIQRDDVVLCISKSGNTPEIKVLVPFIKNLNQGNKIIAMVSNTDSYLALNSDFIIKSTVEKEACPNNLAPTTSTTVQLVLGDALAVCLLECRGFSMDDFAKFHPGGALGKKLYLRVGDLFRQNEVPTVKPTDKLDKVIMEISSKRLGATAVVDDAMNLLGIITDGDLRRMLQRNLPLDSLIAIDIMSENPKTVDENMLAVEANEMMKKSKITSLVVLDEMGKFMGIIHLHDILREGIV